MRIFPAPLSLPPAEGEGIEKGPHLNLSIMHIVGARPNFMKAAPVMAALGKKPVVRQELIHTGQHYDPNMSDLFFHQLQMARPEANLEAGSGSHAVQTARVMTAVEKTFQDRNPDLVLVYGDVNSTLAAALVGVKMNIPIAHVEAGLRSFDRTMPEEINRLLTDQIADLLFTPSADGDENLLQEGIRPEKIHCVGNVMIDTLKSLAPEAEKRWPALRSVWGLQEKKFGLVTLHRPSNVEDPALLEKIVTALDEISEWIPILFPVHPRTKEKLVPFAREDRKGNFHMTEPMGYIDFLALQQKAAFVVTDSGGIQEETTYLGIPCFTLRQTTERPVTIALGTNTLIGQDMERLRREITAVLNGKHKPGRIPPLWDGKAGERIAEVIVRSRGR